MKSSLLFNFIESTYPTTDQVLNQILSMLQKFHNDDNYSFDYIFSDNFYEDNDNLYDLVVNINLLHSNKNEILIRKDYGPILDSMASILSYTFKGNFKGTFDHHSNKREFNTNKLINNDTITIKYNESEVDYSFVECIIMWLMRIEELSYTVYNREQIKEYEKR